LGLLLIRVSVGRKQSAKNVSPKAIELIKKRPAIIVIRPAHWLPHHDGEASHDC
jgi:hypothetical protein